MVAGPLSRVVHFARECVATQEASHHDDGELLGRYIRLRDEPAFETLVRRHGPMVFGVCRRILRNPHDAEDAFQAVFLVLIQKASSLRSRSRLGNWLYGVAHRTALHARCAIRERSTKEMKAVVHDQPTESAWADLQPVFDQELARLPEKYREVLVLCELEGKTRQEAAHLCKCPPGTIASRLARARSLLAKRLSRHVPALAEGCLADGFLSSARATPLAPQLIAATTKVASDFTSGLLASGIAGGEAFLLSRGVLKAMLISKLLKTLAVLSTILIVAVGTGLGLAGSWAANATDEHIQSPVVQPERKPIDVPDHEKLLASYTSNEIAADAAYGNKQIRTVVTAGIRRTRIKRFNVIDGDWAFVPGEGDFTSLPAFLLTTTLTFPSSPDFDMKLVFGFPADAQAQLGKLTTGDGGTSYQVTIEGLCIGRAVSKGGKEILRIKNCKIVDVRETPKTKTR